MSAYYNEFDPFAAAWLRELIKRNLIAPGDVDERSITEVKPDDIRGYTQCHFFAGIGGWSYALRLALWPDDRPVWTGSAPCQPFSSAGKQKGKADERHLFPVWLNLIRECRPSVCFGEQVASAVAHGWLDDVYQGLEAEDYAVGSAILPACSVGAPHRRDRLWFVANTEQNGRFREGLPSKQQKGFSCASRRDNKAPWSALPMPGNTKDKPNFPMLLDGIPNRVGKLRGYGNAIVPQVASAFIIASQGAHQ